MRDSIRDRKKEQKKGKDISETEICREDFCLLTYTYPLKTKHERERERGREQRQSGEVLSDFDEGLATLIGIFFFFLFLTLTKTAPFW
jgi:hypothetical protein